MTEDVDQTKAEVAEEIEKSTTEFEKENDTIVEIESSAELSNPEGINSVKEGLQVDSSIAELDTQARILKQETEKQIEWVMQNDHEFNENNFYRVVDENGYGDMLETDVVRSSPEGTQPKIVDGLNIGNRPTSFPSFSKGAPDSNYSQESADNYILESDIPMYKRGDTNPVTGNPVKGRHWAYRPIDSETGETLKELSVDKIKQVFKKDIQGNLLRQESKKEEK